MRRMATVPEQASPAGGQSAARAAAAWVAAALIGSVLLGLLAGLIWGEVAPRAVLQEIGSGTAQLVNAETTAFIGADAWFSGIAAVAGLITGLAGYRFGVAPPPGGGGAAVAAGLIVGAIAAAFVMLWLGEQIGLSSYNQHLAASPDGTVFHASLVLGAKSALAFWPMFTAIVILVAEWGTRRTRDPREPEEPEEPGEPGEPPEPALTQ
jgi:hypothetical protein